MTSGRVSESISLQPSKFLVEVSSMSAEIAEDLTVEELSCQSFADKGAF
jgi:hypothetical protein